jgi:hypothetical protein
MTREEIKAMLGQHIEGLQIAQETIDPTEEEKQLFDDGLAGTKDLLRRTKEGDEAAIQEISDLLEMG